jgi:hypothetical protein
MSTVEPLYCLMTRQLEKYSKSERIILEAGFFSCVCKQLKEMFRKQNREYFRLMKFTIEMENAMLDADFICFVIKDILSTNEYNLQGIAYYTNIHEDVIYEILTGKNNNPSAIIFQKIIDLHCSVRAELYREIIKKVALDYLAVA